MATWKLSVAEPLPRFNRGAKRSTTLNAAVSASATSIQLEDEVDSFYLDHNVLLQLGPSSSTSNLGAVETIQVSTVTNSTTYTTVTTPTPTQYAYTSGDPVTYISNNIPQGWEFDWPVSADSNIAFSLTPMKYGAGGYIIAGMDSMEGLWVSTDEGTTDWHYLTHYLRRPLLTGVVYRMGVFSLCPTIVNAGSVVYRLYDGTNNKINVTGLNAAHTSWTRFESTGTPTVSDSDSHKILFGWDYNWSSRYHGFSMPYLTHAALTDGASSGAYTLPVEPSAISDLIGYRGIVANSSNGYGLTIDSLYTEQAKGYKLVFQDVSATMLRNLEALQYWQDLGFPIQLDISGWDSAKFTRPVQGYMDYTLRYDSWDDQTVTVDMIFQGV